MKYRDTHTGEIQEWHLETLRFTHFAPIEFMVSESGDRWVTHGWARLDSADQPTEGSGAQPFLECHEPVEEPAARSAEETQ